jgi:hypothetical protein
MWIFVIVYSVHICRKTGSLSVLIYFRQYGSIYFTLYLDQQQGILKSLLDFVCKSRNIFSTSDLTFLPGH